MHYAEHSEGRFEGALPAGLISHIEQHLNEFGLALTRQEDSLHVAFSQAEIHLRFGPARMEISIGASSKVHLHQSRESVLYLLDHVFPEAAERMGWSGTTAETRVPPNFHPATVLSVTRPGANFLRVEMGCDGVAALSTGGMHFSLLLPPDGRAPVWPSLNDKGRTVWPEGADALHRAAYTFVTLDAAAGRFSFDIFEHDGGRATDWARRARPGTAVAVMGPGGGDFPPGDFLLIAGDETALPAIRRILERSTPDRRGSVLIEIGDPADQCEMPRPGGMELRWIVRGGGATLWEALQETALPEDGQSRFVWVAAEQDLVRRAKAHFRDAGRIGRAEGYFSAYWSAAGH